MYLNIKKGRQKPIVYEILSECSKLVKDEFWKQFYEDLASGKSTKGIYIANGIIQTSNKRNGFNYSITDKAPEVIIQELHNLLINHTGIYSQKDINKRRIFIKEIKDELDEYKNCKWTGIKRKNVKNMLIVNYVTKLMKKYKLSSNIATDTYNMILNTFDTKTHTSKDVIYENGKIISIKDIEYDEDTKTMVNRREVFFIERESEKEQVMDKLFYSYISGWVKTVKG